MSREDKHREGDTPTPGEPPDPDKLSEEQPATPFDDVTDHTTDSASSEPTEETNELSDEQEEDSTSEVLDGDFDIFDPAEDGEVENEEPIATSADYESSSDASLSGTLSNDETEKFIEEIESEQEYIQITPVREEVNSETVTRELYGLHRYGNGRKLPLDLDLHLGFIKSPPNFEFIIYKPADEAQFKFFIGSGERGDVTCDRLESTTRSQYPENFEFDREHFDITDVFDEVPEMIRWEGVEEKRRDWMTTLASYDNEAIERSPLSNLLETIIQADGSVIFQCVFEPRSDWSPKAERQKGNLKQGVHTTGGLFLRTLLDGVLGVSDEEKKERHRSDTPHEIGGSIHDSQTGGYRPGTSRMGQIDLKNPSHTYNVTLRAAASSADTARNLQDSLNQVSGKFYSIEGNYLGTNEAEYKRMLNHGLTYPNGLESWTRRKPLLVCNIDELANFITVPSIDSLPKASRGGTGGMPTAQSPLTSPNEEVFKEFSKGMTIGHAVTALRDEGVHPDKISTIESKNEWWEHLAQRDAISLSADHLTQHYIRAATTGSGKTVATLNDMLTSHNDLEGPTVLIDPKDGEMCENYLRCHRTLFSNLDDVEYIKIPEEDGMVPGMPFFDLRPLTKGAGRTRETAKQDIIDHYFQILRFVLGKKTVEQAFVANEILTNLIKALFDSQYGKDYFSIGELMEAAQDFQKWGKQVEDLDENYDKVLKALPRTSDTQVTSILESHLEKDARQFMNTTDAVLNRIRKLKERDFIWDMLSFKIEDEYWNDETNWYSKEIPMLDMKSILNSNKVVLIDTGSLRGASSEVFTVLFLSHLWTAAQSIWTPNDDEYITNVIIEESANIARNEIVYRELLPKGREFNLSLGLIMQYPEQVLGDNPQDNRRAYKEILNNINTKIIGNVATDDLLAESLFHEDLDNDEIKDRIAGLRRGEWLVQLPSTGFHKQKPEVLTLRPLPLPPGHNAGPFKVNSLEDRVRARSRDRHCVNRAHDAIDIDSGVNAGSSESDDEDGDEDNEEDSIEDKEGYSFEHKVFLSLVFDALTDGVNGYHIKDSMKELPHSERADDLVEWGFLEKFELGNRQAYYWPTDEAGVIVDQTLAPRTGGEYGSESPEHRVGVLLIKEYYDKLGYETHMYHSPEEKQKKFDLVAEPTADSPDDRRKIVEVETSPEKKRHVVDDSIKLAQEYGDAIWVVENNNGLRKLLSSLTDQIGYIKSASTQSFKKTNEKLDADGIQKLFGINKLRDDLNED
ncbi:ATP-binding protein [Halorubrum ezzemoulense]|uniref:ATP-binding protein n=1 Tax=Halorubrum ezzemoulense TaxID=337243 RepID=UPI00232F959D|nr:ATP-binding protein [Halorubrum ezzemoulense]MDB9234943.1 ATP-binding protein [Halorubrum ezzemoulense]